MIRFMNESPYSFHSGLLTDLYELTMAAGYIQNQFEARATFELFPVIFRINAITWWPPGWSTPWNFWKTLASPRMSSLSAIFAPISRSPRRFL